jgi:DNA-binding NarL/FixJ family response regulator
MEQMTQEQEATPGGEIAALHAPPAPRLRGVAWLPAALFAGIALFSAVDVASDVADGAGAAHVALEAVLVLGSLVGLAHVVRQLRSAEARARDLERDLDGTRADLARWRAEAQEHVEGLGAAIDRQFLRWQLTPAEREVALLLLKGLALKDVAQLRATSERTVRQQSLAIYRKSGLAGRAELAAFFLEDLLSPRRGEVDASAASR